LATKIKVIDRRHLGNVLNEQKFASVYGDQTTIKKLEIIGADVIIVGTIVKFDKFFKITSKVIDISTSEIIHTARWEIYRDSSLDRMYSIVTNNDNSQNDKSIKNGKLLRLLSKETERMNKGKEIRVRPLDVISDNNIESGSYQATVKYQCIYTNPFERGVIVNTTEISGNIYKPFMSSEFKVSGITKLYNDCEGMSPSTK
jgi:hypothetical protein